jgi:hypothetical protein
MSQNYTQIKNNNQLINVSDFFLDSSKGSSNLKSLYSFLENFQTINENGNINPLEKWIIEAIYNISKIQPKKETKNIPKNKNNKPKLYDISGGYTINKYDISANNHNNQNYDGSGNNQNYDGSGNNQNDNDW